MIINENIDGTKIEIVLPERKPFISEKKDISSHFVVENLIKFLFCFNESD